MRINPIISTNTYKNVKPATKNMQAVSSECLYSPSFTSRPIYKAAAIRENKDGTKTRIPVIFSELNHKEIEDYRAILGLRFNFGDRDGCGKIICRDFISHTPPLMRYYAIETDEKDKPLKDRILALAEADVFDMQNIPTPNIQVGFLQSLKDIKPKQHQNIKGAGELCLYGIIRLAKDKNLHYVYLRSEKDGFYDHIEFGEKEQRGRKNTYYVIKNESFDKFIKRVQNRYGFQPR